MLLLEIQRGILQAKGLHGLRLPPEAAMADAALAPLHLGRQPSAAATAANATALWVVAGEDRGEERGARST